MDLCEFQDRLVYKTSSRKAPKLLEKPLKKGTINNYIGYISVFLLSVSEVLKGIIIGAEEMAQWARCKHKDLSSSPTPTQREYGRVHLNPRTGKTKMNFEPAGQPV